jgi:accessory gene regulator protein AgrB
MDVFLISITNYCVLFSFIVHTTYAYISGYYHDIHLSTNKEPHLGQLITYIQTAYLHSTNVKYYCNINLQGFSQVLLLSFKPVLQKQHFYEELEDNEDYCLLVYNNVQSV